MTNRLIDVHGYEDGMSPTGNPYNVPLSVANMLIYAGRASLSASNAVSGSPEDGFAGFTGWTAIPNMTIYAGKLVMHLTWVGGTGTAPTASYVGPNKLVAIPADAADMVWRMYQGEDTTEAGVDGFPVVGKSGWSPVPTLVADGARQVMHITWSGGTGTPPPDGFVGAGELVTTAALAVNLKGESVTAGPHQHAVGDVTGLSALMAGKVDSSLLGVASGVAELDSTGKLKASQIPASALVDVSATGMTLTAGVLKLTQDEGGPDATVDLNSFATDAELTAGLAGKAPSTHTHTVAQIGDAGAAGRSLLQMATMPEIQSAVSEGVVTSDRVKTAITTSPFSNLSIIVPVLSGEVDAIYFGVKNDGAPTQAAMDALMASGYKKIRFRPGIYNATLANGQSGRTFYFDERAVIDGTIHLAVGIGPDIGGTANGPISLVKDTYCMGSMASSVRLGTYYCDGVHIDRMHVTEVDSVKYPGQAAYGGSFGIHLYCGTRNLYLPDILIDSASAGAYAIGVDISTTDDADHWPTNIAIGKAVVRGSTQCGVNTVKTSNLSIADLDIQTMGAYNGAMFSGDRDLRVDRLKIKGAGAAAAKDGVYVTNQANRASFGRVSVAGTTQIGVRTIGAVPVDFEHIMSSGNGLDQVRLQTPGRIGQIEASGGTTGYGVNITTGAAGLNVGRIDSHGNAVVNLFVDPNDVSIENILTYGSPTGYGVFLNSAQRFRTRTLETYGCSQGLRVIGASVIADVIHAHDNTNGITGSGITQWSVGEFIYSGNTTDTNVSNSAQPGYRSKVKQGVGYPGDADITPTHGTTGDVILYGVPLTANRTVTLSTTGAVSGETRYRITRDGGATGAFTVTVMYKALSVNQWIDVAFFSGSWRVVATGSL